MSVHGLFSKPEHESKDPDVRLRAVGELDDQHVLAELAKTDTSPRVREAAVTRISDQDILMDVALNGREIDARVSAVGRIESQQNLAEVIKVRKNYQLMGACFARITNREILQQIAYDTSYNMSARRMAIENFADESFLEELGEPQRDSVNPKSAEEVEAYIARYGGERLVRALGKFRGSKAAIQTLGEIVFRGGDSAKAAIEYVAQAIIHPNTEVAEAARNILAKLKQPGLIAKLISLMDSSKLHDGILDVLREIDHPDARQIIDSADS